VNIFLFHKKKKGSSNSSPWKESCMKREAKIPSKSIKIIEGILLKSHLYLSRYEEVLEHDM